MLAQRPFGKRHAMHPMWEPPIFSRARLGGAPFEKGRLDGQGPDF
jgi:hypothetical protein